MELEVDQISMPVEEMPVDEMSVDKITVRRQNVC
jgi:hypothetical protein